MRVLALSLLLILPAAWIRADDGEMVMLSKSQLQALIAKYGEALEQIDKLDKALHLAKIKSGCI